MTDAAYVIAGWVITSAALGGYLARVLIRTRRARKLLGPAPWEAGLGSPPTPR